MVLAKLLIFSTTDENMRYATGLNITDPFIWVRIERAPEKAGRPGVQEFVIVSKLEYSRVKEGARPRTRVVLLDTITDKLRKEKRPKRPLNLADAAAFFLRERKVTQVLVPENFWSSHLETLREHRLRVRIESPFFPQRIVKSQAEIAAIKRTGMVTQKAMRHALGILRAATIGRDRALSYRGKPLTSERLKEEIEGVFLKHGCASGKSIVACGEQAAQPHNTGSGRLRAGEPIVIDIFPRDLKTGYFSDMTRTVVKGAPRPELKQLYAVVLRAQKAGLAAVQAGAKASDVDAACRKLFEDAGYKTSAEEGFIHSTGHGLGLAIHEQPRLAPRNDAVLRPRMVVTIEPGLYYKRLGGVRIEDTVVVAKGGCVNLTRTPKRFTL